MKWLCNLLFPETVTKPGEMAPGIPRPTYVLAGLICTEILKNPREAYQTKDWERSASKASTYKWTNSKRDAHISIQIVLNKDYPTDKITGVQSITKTIMWEGKRISDVFHEEDLLLITNAINKADELRVEFIKQEEEQLRQQIACDLIEKFTLGKVHEES